MKVISDSVLTVDGDLPLVLDGDVLDELVPGLARHKLLVILLAGREHRHRAHHTPVLSNLGTKHPQIGN